MVVIADVKTNCESDSLWRVSVDYPDIWGSGGSPLLPVLNGVYLEEGDKVLVYYEEVQSAFVLGKVYTKEGKDKLPDGSKPVVFSGKKGGQWVIQQTAGGSLYIKNNAGTALTLSGGKVVLKGGNKDLGAVLFELLNGIMTALSGATVDPGIMSSAQALNALKPALSSLRTNYSG